MRHSFLAAIALIAALAGGAAAQAPHTSAWFGVPVPHGLGDPHKPILDVTALKPAPPSVPAGEESYRDLVGSNIRRDLEAIVGIAKADRARGEKAWGRITGFRAADETHARVLDQFKAAGLKDPATQTYEATQATWYPKSWDVKLLANAKAGAGSRDVVLESAFPTSGSQLPGGPLDAALVLVGATTDPALPDVDVTGKVAVQTLHPQAGAFSERTRTTERARALAKRGAVAVLNVIEQAGNMHVRDFSNCGVPCFNLGADDGRFLRAVAECAAAAGVLPEIRIHVALQTEMRQALKGHNTIGLVPGRRADEIVIVNAHADGWFDAAGDNGDGLAVLVALARHFARPEHQPDRTLLFVASGGHHGGGMNGPGKPRDDEPAAQWQNGAGAQSRAHRAAAVPERSVPREPRRTADGIRDFERGAGHRGCRATRHAAVGFALRPNFSSSTAGDLGGYAPLGVPRVQAIHSGPMYHTSGDTLDTISTPGLERAARFYRFFIDEIGKTDRARLQSK
jgi:hypothetical protein